MLVYICRHIHIFTQSHTHTQGFFVHGGAWLGGAVHIDIYAWLLCVMLAFGSAAVSALHCAVEVYLEDTRHTGMHVCMCMHVHVFVCMYMYVYRYK